MPSAAEPTPPPIGLVVLAGGRSRRFGADKLAADLDGMTLLDRVLADARAALPECAVVVVGPARRCAHPVTFVREDPPGSGPAAALVAGITIARQAGADFVVTVPGDAPGAGSGARLLLNRLRPGDGPDVAVGVAPDGRLAPLQLGLTASGAARLIAAAGPNGAADLSARVLVERLDPVAVQVPLPASAVADVDTPDDLASWREDVPPERALTSGDVTT